MEISVDRVHKAWDGTRALHDVSLHVPSGSMVALLGPSGSGKTTLLRVIAGLEAPDAGTVRFDGRDVSHLGVRERGVGFVFQHYALFGHLDVADNVAFGLRVMPRARKPSEPEIRRRVDALLELVQLTGLASRLPSQLSGGQRQRVALARALAVEPRVLLLDEPFAALDARVRASLRAWLRGLHRRLGVTGLFVTHDQDEALEVADHVAVIHEGQVRQVGTPQQIVEHPADSFVHAFIGAGNALDGEVREGAVHAGPFVHPAPGWSDGSRVRLQVRARDVRVEPDPAGPLTVARVLTQVDGVRLELRGADGHTVVAALPDPDAWSVPPVNGLRVRATLRRVSLHSLDGAAVPAGLNGDGI